MQWRIHVLRACYVAAMWKQATEAKPSFPEINFFGWKLDGRIQWAVEIYPEEVKDILFDDQYDEEEFLDDEGESGDEEV